MTVKQHGADMVDTVCRSRKRTLSVGLGIVDSRKPRPYRDRRGKLGFVEHAWDAYASLRIKGFLDDGQISLDLFLIALLLIGGKIGIGRCDLLFPAGD